MLTEGLGLMVAGMGVVFSFLTLLVLTMNVTAMFFEKFADHFQDEAVPSGKSKKVVVQQSDDELAEIAVAIAAAKACAGS